MFGFSRAGLNENLHVDIAAASLPQLVLQVLEFSLQLAVSLHPQLLHVRLQLGRLQADAGETQDQETEEDVLPGVLVDSSSENEELLLDLGPEPERLDVSGGSAALDLAIRERGVAPSRPVVHLVILVEEGEGVEGG